MSMLVARMEKKNTQNLGGMQKHNQREFKNHSNKEIDAARSHLNYDLVNAANIDYREKIMGIIESQKIGTRAIRKDAVLVNEWIITSDQQFFKGMDPDDCRDFFKHTTDWFKERYGSQNIAFANVHLDETTPHMHLGVVPMRDGRLQAKNVFNRTELLKVQEELPKYLKSKSFDIERGVEGSKTKHLTVPEYKEMKREIESLEKDKDKSLSEFIELATRASEASENTKVLESRKRALEAENERLRGIVENNKMVIGEQVKKYKAEEKMYSSIRKQYFDVSKIKVIDDTVEKREGLKKVQVKTGWKLIKNDDWQEVKALAVAGEAFHHENEKQRIDIFRLEEEKKQLEKEKKEVQEENLLMKLKYCDYEDLQKENTVLKKANEMMKNTIEQVKEKYKEMVPGLRDLVGYVKGKFVQNEWTYGDREIAETLLVKHVEERFSEGFKSGAQEVLEEKKEKDRKLAEEVQKRRAAERDYGFDL